MRARQRQKPLLIFNSIAVDSNEIITLQGLAECLPGTVRAQPIFAVDYNNNVKARPLPHHSGISNRHLTDMGSIPAPLLQP